jgi:hypothetical protein
MDMSGRVHAPTALIPGKDPSSPTEYERVWAPDQARPDQNFNVQKQKYFWGYRETMI